MESAANLLVVVDAGHGGQDFGARFGERLEKDDNLRLALEVQKQLLAQGMQVLMTRAGDTFVTPGRRAEMANGSDADLFLSLHRNFRPGQDEFANGAEALIFFTGPVENSGLAAQLVLSEVARAGVRQDLGVRRGNVAALRRVRVPAMVLEMGFISDEGDNELFDRNLQPYAKAIAKGISDYFNLPFRENAEAVRPASCGRIAGAQGLLEERYGFGLVPSGRYDGPTRRAGRLALQIELNGEEAGLVVDGVLGPRTMAAIRPVGAGESGGLAALTQVLLILNGYSPGQVDGRFGPKTAAALRFFQRDNYIRPDGVAGKDTFQALLCR